MSDLLHKRLAAFRDELPARPTASTAAANAVISFLIFRFPFFRFRFVPTSRFRPTRHAEATAQAEDKWRWMGNEKRAASAVRHALRICLRQTLLDRLHTILFEFVVRSHNRQVVFQCRRDDEPISRIVMDVR